VFVKLYLNMQSYHHFEFKIHKNSLVIENTLSSLGLLIRIGFIISLTSILGPKYPTICKLNPEYSQFTSQLSDAQ